MENRLLNNLTVFVISCGNNPNFEDCLRCLEEQDTEFKIEIIKDVSPMSAAFQQMIDRCKTRYYVQVDEDMCLFTNAIGDMYDSMNHLTNSKTVMMAFMLRDIHFEKDIYGIKIYDWEVFKRYPYNLQTLSCEVEQLDRLKSDGYKYDLIETVVGNHAFKWNEPDVFERYYNLMEKFRQFKYSWMSEIPGKLFEKVKEDPSDVNIFALLGSYTSVLRDIYNIPIQKDEKNFSHGKLREYKIMESYVKMPTSATIYMTSRCNYRCEWCYRQHNQIEQAPDFTVEQTEYLLKKFPSIIGVCICGFGEPLMSANLVPVIQMLKRYKRVVGLITNGSKLVERIDEIADAALRPDYISISLNAHNAEEHRKVTGTDTWVDVLKGIELCVKSGINTFSSFVCTKQNLDIVPQYLRLMKEIGIKTVHLHNLLPHFDDSKNLSGFILEKSDTSSIDKIRALSDSDIVKSWPVLIDNEVGGERHSRRSCRFPWDSIAMNGNGSISICNSVFPCNKKNGKIEDDLLWQNSYCQKMRLDILDDSCEVCKKCFRNY